MHRDHAATVNALEEALRQTGKPVVCAYLFGSEARGSARPGSDLDVAVLLADCPPRTLTGPLTGLQGELERAAGREIDLLDLRTAPPDLVHRVLRDGRLLVERDPTRRIQFEVAARNAYFDLLPHLRRYRRGQAA